MKRERGQALILVLILLAIGPLLIVPLLQLVSTIVKSSPMYRQFTNEDYAADAAMEYGLWRLNYEPGYAASLPIGVESPPFYITLNGVTATTTVTPQATSGPGEQLSGQPLMNNDIFYKVTKIVTPDTANVGEVTTFTYTVAFKSYDPTASNPLEEIKDILSREFGQTEGYVPNSTYWEEASWGIAPFEPSKNWKSGAGELYWELKWKLKDRLPPGISFTYGETKWMSFQVRGALAEGVWGNDITVKPGEKDMGAFQAPITVGDPAIIGTPFGFLDINKTTDTPIMYPNVTTNVTYTVTATNVDVVPMIIEELQDWLPSTGYADPAFVYTPNSATAFITHTDNSTTIVPMPDTYPDAQDILKKSWKDSPYMRWELTWDFTNHQDARFDPIFLEPGEVLTVSFMVSVTPRASGLYYNEFIVVAKRYPLNVAWTMNPVITNPPATTTTIHYTVNMTNIDVYYTDVDKLKAWLPGLVDDTGQDERNWAFKYKVNTTKVNDVLKVDNDTYWKDKKVDTRWDNKKRRWQVDWEPKTDIRLNPGVTLKWEFDVTVAPSNPAYTFNQLLWEATLIHPSGLDYDRDLYSFPTAGVMVPMYDLEVNTLYSTLMTNAWLGSLQTIHPKSVNWEKHR